MRDLVTDCINVQVNAIGHFKPDILIGSSWGGALAVQMLCTGLWKGPVMLVAPAQNGVAKYTGIQYTLPTKLPNVVHIYHGTADNIIPFEDSERLTADLPSTLFSVSPFASFQETGKDTQVKLFVVDGDDHQVSKTVTPQKLTEMVDLLVKESENFSGVKLGYFS